MSKNRSTIICQSVKVDVVNTAPPTRSEKTREKKLKGAVDAKPQTAAKPRVLCQAENVFSRAATEEGSTGNPDSPTTRCTAHIKFASSAAPHRREV